MLGHQSPPPRYDPAPVAVGISGSPISPRKSESYDHEDNSLPNEPLLSSKRSLLDELLPLPSSARQNIALPTKSNSIPFLASKYLSHVLRRTLALAVVVIFLSAMIFMACTQGGKVKGSAGLKSIFGVGELTQVGVDAGWVAEDIGDPTDENDDLTSIKDFDKYTMMLSVPPQELDILTDDKRVIFVGDIHGSFDPLQRLMTKINYKPNIDTLIHVGDLVAKGPKSEEVVQWMIENRVKGVRGNHDHPVVQWRSWMEWAGGKKWEEYIEGLDAGGKGGMLKALGAEGKMFPKGWEWNSEHWKIAKSISQEAYRYLVDLPMVLHLPSMHSVVVHAGLLPADPLKSPTDPSQPLMVTSTSYFASVQALRTTEELSILLDVPQNTVPWNLMNMRSAYEGGVHKGEITEKGKKGTPWSKIWAREMARCGGEGSWLLNTEEDGDEEDETLEDIEDGEGEVGNETSVDDTNGEESSSGETTETEATIPEDVAEEEDGPDREGAYVPDETELWEPTPQPSPTSFIDWGDIGHKKRDIIERTLNTRATCNATTSSSKRDVDESGDLNNLNCSPVTVIYGHAAGRGLDIKPFSKGLDTGCVYGRKLTALILGDVGDLDGKVIRVGNTQGLLVHVDCEDGGF